MKPKCFQTWEFPDLFVIISNGVEVDTVAMLSIAMANEHVSPTDNSPHMRATFFLQENKSIQKVCITNSKQKVFYEYKLCKLMSRNDVTIFHLNGISCFSLCTKPIQALN